MKIKQISENGLNFIASWEAFRPLPYRDIAGYWTVGYGHRIKAGEQFTNALTKQQAKELMLKDLQPVEDEIQKMVTVELNQNQYDAFCSLCYNVGTKAIKDSPLLKHINAMQFDIALEHWKLYCMAGGRWVKGLENRRLAEIELFKKPITEGEQNV